MQKNIIRAVTFVGFFLLSKNTMGIHFHDIELRIGSRVEGGQLFKGYVDGADHESIKRVLAIPVIKKLAEAYQPTLSIAEDSGRLYFKATHGSVFFFREIVERLANSTLSTQEYYLEAVLGDKRHAPNIIKAYAPKGFDALVYLHLNPDVESFVNDSSDKEEATIAHFLNFGEDERRSFIPSTFDPESYLALNPDVASLARTWRDPAAFAVRHNLILAPHENRPYFPKGYHPEVYLKLNHDLAAAAAGASSHVIYANNHYLEFGRYEGRSHTVKIPDGFLAGNYYQLNTDISDAYFSKHPYREVCEYRIPLDAESFNQYARDHYRIYGFFEGRSYKK
jgi:hypothetical protein